MMYDLNFEQMYAPVSLLAKGFRSPPVLYMTGKHWSVMSPNAKEEERSGS